MRWRIPLVVLLALFVAVSCDQQPVEPPEQATVTTPSFDFSNGPTERGPHITVYNDLWLGGWITYGEDLWHYAYGYDGDCDITADWEYVSIKEFERLYNDPEVPPLVMQTWKGDVNWLVGTYPIDCENVIAYGTGHFVNTDNDVMAWAEGREQNRVNSFGWHINGNGFWLSDGSKAHAQAVAHIVWTGYPDYEEKHASETVKVR